MRFRPILMTCLAFVFGVLPMVIATGAGGASQQALGSSVTGGMLAVVIRLLFIPVFFVGVMSFFSRKDKKAGVTKDETEAEIEGPPAPAHGQH